ncbi:MAG: twin-arginine translocase subunit TatC [Gammaproteobacteria bacterium]|nr:twin-arginine translocase subunit TatC [Gammaproteobacteria bacterium]
MTQNNQREAETNKEQSFISHLIELRDRLLRSVVGVMIIFIILFPFANPLYTLLSGPLTKHLPEGSSMIAIEVASPLLIPLKMVLLLSVVIAVPWLLYQAWSFIAPGLYQHERRLAAPILISSTLLFYLGMAFAYFVVFPLVFGFFTSTAPEGVAVMTDIGKYLDFIILIFLAFGLAFEVPIVTVVLVKMEVTSPQALAKKRPYVIVGAFVIGMFLTPPDIISQVMLAVPVWLLFEMGLFFSRFILNPQDEAKYSQNGDVDRYRPLTEEEMEAELDSIERDEGKEK